MENTAEIVVDLAAIAYNTRVLKQCAGSAQLMAIVKADAYNHGLEKVVETVLTHGADQLGVATFAEALELRGFLDTTQWHAVPVHTWLWYPGQDLQEVCERNITVGVPSLVHLQKVYEYANTASSPVAITLLVDTGLSRSGISPEEWPVVLELLQSPPVTLRISGVATHLSAADDSQDPLTDTQNARFAQAIADVEALGYTHLTNHIANTAATLTRTDLRYQMVRPGVGIYGVNPTTGVDVPELKPAMTFRGRVITTRVVSAGEGVSYSHTWVAAQDTRTAVISVGYADGVPRIASGKFMVTINGSRYPQIGRICMDQIVVDLGPVDSGDTDTGEAISVQPGDWAEIFGPHATAVKELAQQSETIDYEILTMPRGRVQRRYITEDAVTPSRFPQEGSCVVTSVEDMWALGKRWGEELEPGQIMVLTGPLGAGKTTLVQGIAHGMGVKGRVSSPTFTIAQEHKPGESGIGLIHMDAYRLLGDSMGVDTVDADSTVHPGVVFDALDSLDIDTELMDSVVVAEWGRGLVEVLSDKVIDVEISRELAQDFEATEDDPFGIESPRTVSWKYSWNPAEG